MSSASSPTKLRSRGSSTISPLGCPPWSAEHESNRTRTHDSYTTPWDTITPCERKDEQRSPARLRSRNVARVLKARVRVATRLLRLDDCRAQLMKQPFVERAVRVIRRQRVHER